MSMEKYGVSDRKELQRKELLKAKSRLATLRGSSEKTASETQEIVQVEARINELKMELADQ